MAMDCLLLAIINTVCIGATAMMVYAFIQLAWEPHSKGSIAASVYLLFSISLTAGLYTVYCCTFFQQSALLVLGLRHRHRGTPWRRPASLPAVPESARPSKRQQRLQRSAAVSGPGTESHARAGPGSTGAWWRAGGDCIWHPGVRAAGGRRWVRVHDLPRGGGEGGRGEADAGVPAHVSPAVHRPVAT
uniref:Uncharacterized protein n=1 Tax=Triticum aestivum TaxID=4565 RepID=A0A077S2Q9_WHEAT|nr:unnamed protein product [Triticum aestivum]